MNLEQILKISKALTGRKQHRDVVEKRASKIRGRKYSAEHCRKISESQKDEKGNNWRGEKATYNSIHHWVRNKFGRPNKCEHCHGIFTGLKIHWANISGNYTRERNDWIRLCAKCHRKYDRENPIVCKRLHSHK